MKTLFLFLFLFASAATASAHQVTVTPLPLNNSFPSNHVYRIMQDKEGFLWMATLDGLCRYDGYNTLVFRSNPSNPQLLTSNEITCLAEDHFHTIWIGSKEGLNRLDKKTYKITPFNDVSEGKTVHAILCASDSSVWVAVDDKTYRYRSEGRGEAFSVEHIDLGVLVGVNQLYEDRRGDIWILTWSKGLFCYKKDGQISRYPKLASADNPFRIYQDADDRYWLCTWGNGMYRFYPDRAPADMYEPYPVYDQNGLEEGYFFGMVQDRTFGYFWLLSTTGIYVVKPRPEGSFEQIDFERLFAGMDRKLNEIVIDSKGNLWVATANQKAFSINFDKPDIQSVDLQKVWQRTGQLPFVTALCVDDDLFWFNQYGYGACLYNQRTNRLSLLHDDVAGISAYRYLFSSVSSIEKKGDETWFASSRSGQIASLVQANGAWSFNRLIVLNAVREGARNIRKLFKDSKGNVWIVSDRHVFVSPKDSDAVLFTSDTLDDIHAICESPDGKIWLANKRNEVYSVAFDGKSEWKETNVSTHETLRAFFPNNRMAALAADRDGDIWIGTKNGNVCTYSPADGKITDRTPTVNVQGEAILNIVADSRNHLWLSTNKRVTEYSKPFGAVREYSTADQLPVNSLHGGACFFDKARQVLYLGGNKGICRFSSFDFRIDESRNHPVVVADVTVGGKSLLTSAGQNQFDPVAQRLTLNPDDKDIEVHFSSLNYTNPDKIVYAYKMEGVDDNWIHTDRQFASYKKLKKGRRQFQVKATDENRIWNNETALFQIYKQPAFYETWWAYAFYALLSLAVSYASFCIVRNRIRLKQKLEIAQIEKEKSEELAQTKLRYFTGISHDLLTPLTIISCVIDDIETVVAQQASQFVVIRTNVDRLKRLFQQVLDFRKMESGNMKLKVTSGNLSAFVKDICLNSFEPLFRKKEILFSFETEQEEMGAYFDADKVEKIVYHLIDNALKYTPKKGTIKVSIQTSEREGRTVAHINIQDSGRGIEPENTEKIFTYFYDNRNMEAGLTNGIGLSLTRDLVKLHHGTISVDSRLNVGSTFSVSIPISREAFSDSELADKPRPIAIVNDEKALTTVTDDEKKQKIPANKETKLLLVEDNEDILSALTRILEREYTVFTATHGAQAIEAVEKHDIDLIVSDVMMPEMDGLELTRRLKSNIQTSHIPVLLLTAKNSVEDRIACYDAGADGYISKPFEVKLLKSRIDNFLAAKREKQKEFKQRVEINIPVLDCQSLEEEFLSLAVTIIEKQLNNADFDQNFFAREMNLSVSSLYRKIKKLTGLTPSEFIRNIRLKHACRLLKSKSMSISEVAYAVGFSDTRYFSTCFKAEFGNTPRDFQKQN